MFYLRQNALGLVSNAATRWPSQSPDHRVIKYRRAFGSGFQHIWLKVLLSNDMFFVKFTTWVTSLITIYCSLFPKPLCEGNIKESSLQIYTLNLKKTSACSTHCWCTISAQTEPPIAGSTCLLQNKAAHWHLFDLKSGASPLQLWHSWTQRKISDHNERYRDKSNSLTQ
jgi:hypothetical protein